MSEIEKLIKRVKTLEHQRNTLIERVSARGGAMSREERDIYAKLSSQLNKIASLDHLMENLERKKNPDEIPW